MQQLALIDMCSLANFPCRKSILLRLAVFFIEGEIVRSPAILPIISLPSCAASYFLLRVDSYGILYIV